MNKELAFSIIEQVVTVAQKNGILSIKDSTHTFIALNYIATLLSLNKDPEKDPEKDEESSTS